MEQATVEAAGQSRPVGARIARKIVEDWEGPPMWAIAIVASPDAVLAGPDLNHIRFWPFSSIRKRRLEKRLSKWPWQSQVLPESMGLALDEVGILHFLALKKSPSFMEEAKGELRQWPIHDVKVVITSDSGWWRVVEISDETGAYIVLAPFVLPSQRAALRLIAESSGGA